MAFCPNGGLPVSMAGPVVGQSCMNNNPGLTGPPNQQFCLKWNNHTMNMVKTFTEMIAGESFTDVTLACDGHIIKAHKIVLSACSNYFRDIFLATPCKHPIVVLKDMKIEELKAIIDFMYRGEVNVSQNQLGNLLKTAEILRVKGLTEVNDAEALKPDNEIPQEEAMIVNGGQVIHSQQQQHLPSPMKNGVFPHGVVHQEVIGSVGQMVPFMQPQPQQTPLATSSAKKPRTNKRKSTANPKRTRALPASTCTAVSASIPSSSKIPSSSPTIQHHMLATNVVQSPITSGVVLPPVSSVSCHVDVQHKSPDLEDGEEGVLDSSANNAMSSMLHHHQPHEGEVDSVDEPPDDGMEIESDARARIVVNSYGSVASTSSSTSPPPTSQTYPHETATPDGTSASTSTRSPSKRLVQSQQTGQREVLSAENSLADGMSNDGSESWSQQGNHSMSGYGMGRPPGEEDSESESSHTDVKPYISFSEGSDPGRPGEHINPALGLAPYDSTGQVPTGSSPGQATDASGAKICVCHLCHLTFTAYSSLRRHMARHFQDRERYECDVCFKSYSRKDYLKEHKKLKHPPPGQALPSGS